MDLLRSERSERLEKTLKVFFDANVLISFFRLSNEDVENLQRLVSASYLRKFQIVVTPHLRHEYERFREKAISDGLSNFSVEKLSIQFPPFVKNYGRYEAAVKLIRHLKQEIKDLGKEVREHAASRSLHIDGVIDELFSIAQEIPETPEILAAARLRAEKGHPPRKPQGNLGDALHWESLLSSAMPPETLIIVSRDGDFESDLHSGQPKEFLSDEWRARNGGHGGLEIFKSLAEFTKRYAEGIEINSEYSAEFLVGELSRSTSYKRTHEVIEQLRSAPGLTVGLVERILLAIDFNPQVGDIVGDDDFQDFIGDLYEGFSSSEVGWELYEHLGGGHV